jgi:hypothetical protein
MSALLKISGAVLAILGLTLGAMTFLQPGKMDVYGIKLDTAAIMLVGGILAMGLAGVIDAVRGSRSRQVAETVSDVKAAAPAPSAKPAMADNPFARKAVETTAATGLAAVASASAMKAADPVGETITALEQAKADVIRSMGGMDRMSRPAATVETVAAVKPSYAASTSPAVSEAKPHEEDVTDGEDDDLFVVEEKVIRGRPARILSDDTVEAETDEGWMRFENLEHLNEYLDSVEEQNA